MFSFPRLVTGVEIFKVGDHTASDGTAVSITAEHLDFMVETFNRGIPAVVPVKLGHTSDEFTRMVAAQLGLPEAVLPGEEQEDGRRAGVAALGRVIKVERKQEDLVADLEVPEPIAFMIEDGIFTTVSCELSPPMDDGNRVLVGLALLSAERPAISELKPLASAAVLAEQSEAALVFSSAFPDGVKVKSLKPGVRQKLTEKFMSLFHSEQIGEPEMGDLLAKIKAKLGFSAEDKSVTEDAVVERVGEQAGLIKSLRETLFGAEDDGKADLFSAVKDVVEFRRKKMEDDEKKDDEDDDEKKKKDAPFSEAQFAAAVQAATKPLQERINQLERSDELSKLTLECAKFTAVEGTPEELARTLLELPEAARSAVKASWSMTQKFAEENGIAVSVGSGQRGEGSEGKGGEAGVKFEGLIEDWLKENKGKTRYDAMAVLADSHPTEFAQYAQGVRA